MPCGVRWGLPDSERFPLEPYIVNVSRRPADPGLRAFGGAAEGFGPVAVTVPGLPATASRFTLSRALWHYLWESEPFFLVTTAYTDRQKVERAFAAELLAPAAGIGGLLGALPLAAIQDDIEEIAVRYQVFAHGDQAPAGEPAAGGLIMLGILSKRQDVLAF